MFGNKDKKIKELEEKYKSLEKKVNQLTLGGKPDDQTIVDGVVRELFRRVDPKELLDRILIAQGLTLDGLIKKATRECLREDGLPADTLNELRDVIGEGLSKNLDLEKLIPTVAKEVASALLEDNDCVERIEEKVAENLNTEEFDSSVAERVSKSLLDGNDSIASEVAEKVAESVYENLDDDTLYPAIGEKVVSALQNHKAL